MESASRSRFLTQTQATQCQLNGLQTFCKCYIESSVTFSFLVRYSGLNAEHCGMNRQG